MKTIPIPPNLLTTAIQQIRRGAYPDAIRTLQQVVASQPGHLESRLQLIKACLDWVHILAGVPMSEINPKRLNGEAAHYLLLAEAQINALVSNQSGSVHLLDMLAVVHIIHGRFNDAELCLRKALGKDKRNPSLLFNLGYALMHQGRYDEAVVIFKKLTALYPNQGNYWHELGEAERQSKHCENALPAYRKAIALLPAWRLPYGGLAHTLRKLNRHAEAYEVLLQGVACIPNDRDLSFLLATVSLSIEEWEIGWRYYACRAPEREGKPFTEECEVLLHTGHPVRVRFDQGLGDELFFLRFSSSLVASGNSIHYAAHPKLYPLLQGQQDIAKLQMAKLDEIEPYDVLVGDLPYLSGMKSTTDIPPPLSLQVDSKRVESLGRKLATFGPPPYLGITWKAGTAKREDHKGIWRLLQKEISPAILGEVLKDWPGTIVLFQRSPETEDVAEFSKALGKIWLDWSGINDDLQDALAGLSLLDEYVGVSNTNMHLLAGIGRTARVLMPHPADWRWMNEGDESPWFPGFKVYRQLPDDSWDDALEKLKQDLAAKFYSGVMKQ